ncbi:hypothetical protein CSKR_201256, partial [Clonorchis sinensis]
KWTGPATVLKRMVISMHGGPCETHGQRMKQSKMDPSGSVKRVGSTALAYSNNWNYHKSYGNEILTMRVLMAGK